MNETDDNNESDGDGPAEADADLSAPRRLSAQVAGVLALLGQARAEAEKAGPGAGPRLLTAYRGRFSVAMKAFGEALADVIEQAPQTLDPGNPESPIAPLLEKSRDLPLFRRAKQSINNEEEDHELQRVLLSGRGAGFDLPSLLLEDYFHETVFARSFRSRATAMGELLRQEVCRRVAAGQKEVRLLNLRCGGLVELDPLLEHSACVARVVLTCVDDSTSALRQTRQSLTRKLMHPPRFVRADPLTLGESLNRPRPPFDLILTFSLFDLLSNRAALSFARSCHTLLKPDGALVTSGYSPLVPRGERALALALLGAQVNFRDEIEWRTLLRSASFVADSIRFEHREPAAIAFCAFRDEKTVLQ